jgi:hypothetical protein
MGLSEMIAEMFFTFPDFYKMKDPGNGYIAEKIIAITPGFPLDERDDLPDFLHKIILPIRHYGTLCINK